MPYLFTSESVSEGHPDKIADQVSDAIVDHFLAFDPTAKVACETVVTTGQVILVGEVKANVVLDYQKIAREVIARIGYNNCDYMFEANSCGVLSALHEQSPDIRRGVERGQPEDQGAGDQGMMFGYATNETDNYMPLPLDLAHRILWELASIRREGDIMPYLRPDAKSQVTIEYEDDHVPKRVASIVVSTQHDPFGEDEEMLARIRKDVVNIVIPRVKAQLSPKLQKLFTDDIIYHINPTGKFVIGGPHGDSGLTGRKIIVDTYGGKGAHGGGAFSGKDPSKVDRSGAYATRHVAKNLVAAGVCDEVLVQVSYAIGVSRPTSLYVKTFGTAKVNMTDGEISKIVDRLYDMRPYAIEKRLHLRNPIYSETAAYGHMGRTPQKRTLEFINAFGEKKILVVDLFPWEKLDLVEEIREAFGIQEEADLEVGKQ